MKSFNNYLEDTGEVGTIQQTTPTIVTSDGLPGAKPGELVMFESGGLGKVLSLNPDELRIMLLSDISLSIGTQVARTGQHLTINVGPQLLSHTLNPLGHPIDGPFKGDELQESRRTDSKPPNIESRLNIDETFETGISLIDLAIPLGKGQRELVLGDRKTGKMPFLMQVLKNHTLKGGIGIYTAIAKRQTDIMRLKRFITSNGIEKQTILVASSASNTPGLIYQTPYTAMTIAEYFRDQDKDVLIILDDLTLHAKAYREISLLAHRFPGRNSYPGDIFYTHSRLLERAGKFLKGSITALPVAETTAGDISGYIQTNIMSMTDGHIFFDENLYQQGRRPAINSFLSVTRVGHQTQSELYKLVSRRLSSFLVRHQKLTELQHFGTELSQQVKNDLILGDRIIQYFNQPQDLIVPLPVNTLFIAGFWAGLWREKPMEQIQNRLIHLSTNYLRNGAIKKHVDSLIGTSNNVDDLINNVLTNSSLLLSFEE